MNKGEIPHGSNMNRAELIGQIAARMKVNLTVAELFLDSFISIINDAYDQNEDVRIRGFGNFVTVQHAARRRTNPRTREAVQVPSRKVLKFEPAKVYKT